MITFIFHKVDFICNPETEIRGVRRGPDRLFLKSWEKMTAAQKGSSGENPERMLSKGIYKIKFNKLR